MTPHAILGAVRIAVGMVKLWTPTAADKALDALVDGAEVVVEALDNGWGEDDRELLRAYVVGLCGGVPTLEQHAEVFAAFAVAVGDVAASLAQEPARPFGRRKSKLRKLKGGA